MYGHHPAPQPDAVLVAQPSRLRGRRPAFCLYQALLGWIFALLQGLLCVFKRAVVMAVKISMAGLTGINQD
jgi:hypothetical protein